MKHCISHCSHGGKCVLERDHKGLHDSKYCKWTDEEAISKEEADEKFLLEAKFQGIESLAEFLIQLGNQME